jgi:hypothetical protein
MPTSSQLTNGLCALLAVAGCKSSRNIIPPAPTSAAIPHTTGRITIDSSWSEPDWLTKNCLQIQLRGKDGDLARPYSEVRFLHDERNLYVATYAADINITSDDAFDIDVGPLHERIFVTGKVVPEAPDIDVAVFKDGSLDDPAHKDEEWKLEMSIPIAKTGLAPGEEVDAHVGRCDLVPKDGKTYCGDWSGKLSLQ